MCLFVSVLLCICTHICINIYGIKISVYKKTNMYMLLIDLLPPILRSTTAQRLCV